MHVHVIFARKWLVCLVVRRIDDKEHADETAIVAGTSKADSYLSLTLKLLGDRKIDSSGFVLFAGQIILVGRAHELYQVLPPAF
jgi:hypothetical protein